MTDGLSVFFNLMLFVGVFYLILLYAGLPDRRKAPDARTTETGSEQKRVA